MEYVSLDGIEISNDVGMIKAALEENPEVVFIFTHMETKLFAYIDCLGSEGTDDSYLRKLKICYGNQDIDITYIDKNHAPGCKITSISSLVKILDKSTQCRIIVNNDSKSTLAYIVQQLIYIAYPLSSATILLKKEAEDEEKIKRFMDKTDALSLTIKQAVEQSGVLRKRYYHFNGTARPRNQEEFFVKIDEADKSFGKIREEFGKAQDEKIKIAVTAYTVADRSMIINSITGGGLVPPVPADVTPGIFIYNISSDNKYHMRYEGRDREFDTAKGLYNAINTEFMLAYEKKGRGYKMGDMEIQYVAESSGLRNYIFYDAPLEIIPDCDIVIFVVGFTRYINSDEEMFLRKIKEKNRKDGNKIPLVFAVNKTDELYLDTGVSKSTVQYIDFIQDRLCGIHQDYSESVIFDISARQYFYIAMCGKVCGEEFTRSVDLYADIKFLKKKYPEYREKLAWLGRQISSIDTFKENGSITPEMLKQYSGIPGLLHYVSYMAKAMVQEDVLNNITDIIDRQMEQLKSVTGFVTGIDEMIQINDGKIKSIGSVIDSFKSITGEILDDRITGTDLAQAGKTGRISSYIGVGEKIAGFGAIRKGVREEIEIDKSCLDSELKMLAGFFKKIQDYTYNDLASKVKEKTIDGRIEKSRLSDILSSLITSELLKKAANEIIESYYEETLLAQQQNFDDIKYEIETILNKRTEQVSNAMEYCKKQLGKEAQYSTPPMPGFTFCMPGMRDDIKVKTVEAGSEVRDNLYILQSQVVGKRMNKIRQAWRNLWNGQKGRVDYYVKDIQEESYDKCFKEKFYAPLCDIANDIGFQKRVRDGLDGLAAGIEAIVDDFYAQFSGMDKACRDSLEAFTMAVDDRQKFYSNNEELEKQKNLIEEISQAVAGFSEI